MSHLLIARKKEQTELLDAYQSQQAEFIVVYGRRRIGKTFIIETLYSTQKGFYFQATGIQKGTQKEQLEQFSREMSRCFYQGAHLKTPATWLEAFEALTKAMAMVSARKKIAIFLDELPWMCTKRSRLLQAIDYYWNQHWKRDNRIKLIVCGSSASWIIKKILHNKGGLHNRQTRTLLLRPFTLKETQQFFEQKHLKLNVEQLALIYMLCGGVPYYLSQIKKGLSAAQNTNQLCFQPEGLLYQEFDKLFASLFEEAESYKELIHLIAAKHEGASRVDIEKKSQYSSGGTLTNKLKELEDAGFIQSFLPLEHRTRGLYYRVVDEYCYFYLKWIEPIKNTLVTQERNNQYWSNKIGTPAYYAWLGYAFESLCYKHIREIRMAINFSGSAEIGVWRYISTKNTETPGVQIDLLLDRDDGIVTLCEIKYTQEPFCIDKDYAKRLKNKITVYQKQTQSKKQVDIVLISANGLRPNGYSDELISQVITLEQLISLS